MTPSGYAAPHTLDEAVKLLSMNPQGRVLAGGQTLLVEPSRSRLAGAFLVDLRKIEGLAGMEDQADGSLKIGAMTTVASIADSEAVRNRFAALAEAARLTRDPQVRNRATIGGIIAASDPEADLPAAILALDAQIQITGSKGSRTIRAGDLITGGQGLRLGEVIAAISLPASAKRSGSAYEKFRHPATLGAICGIAASITIQENGKVGSCRVAVTGAAERPARLAAVEKALQSQDASEESIFGAARLAGEGLTFRSDLFASAEYRRHLTGVLAERALKRAVERATA